MTMRCEVCKAPLKVCKARCTNQRCHKEKDQEFYANPLAYLGDSEVETVLAFIANGGNLSHTSAVLGMNKARLNRELAVIKERLDSVIREISILKDYGV